MNEANNKAAPLPGTALTTKPLIDCIKNAGRHFVNSGTADGLMIAILVADCFLLGRSL